MAGQKSGSELYSEGFELLKKNYRKFVLVSAIIVCVGIVADYLLQFASMPIIFIMQFMMVSLSGMAAGFDAGYDRQLRYQYDYPVMNTSVPFLVLFLFCLAAILLFTAAILFVRMLITGTAEMGVKDATLVISEGSKPSFDGTLGRFGRRFWRYVGVTAWALLWTALWGMLFVVPGIVKFYSYRLAPYLALQYPELTVRQVLRKSIEISNGYKGRLFVLDLIRLAFTLGALILSCCMPYFLPFIAAVLWLLPLGYALFVVAYLDIRQAAIEKGLLPPDTEPNAPESVNSSTDGSSVSIQTE